MPGLSKSSQASFDLILSQSPLWKVPHDPNYMIGIRAVDAWKHELHNRIFRGVDAKFRLRTVLNLCLAGWIDCLNAVLNTVRG